VVKGEQSVIENTPTARESERQREREREREREKREEIREEQGVGMCAWRVSE